jgi:hypothetical protein
MDTRETMMDKERALESGWRSVRAGIGRRILTLGLGFLASSCGPDRTDNSPAISRPGEEWTLSPNPTLEIGGALAEGPSALFRVSGARTLPDGRIVIWQSDGEILLFAEDGAFERFLGREGEGPGEFRWVEEVALVMGTGDLRVLDPSNSRITTLTPEGELQAMVRVEPNPLVLARTWRGQPDGSFVGWVEESLRKAVAREERGLGIVRDSIHVIRLTDAGVEVLETREGGARFWTRSGNVTMGSYPPLGRRLLTALGPRMFAQGFNDQGVFQVLSLEGDTVGVVRAVTPRRPISPEVRAQAEREFLARTHLDPVLGEGREEMFRRILEGAPEPEYLPLVDLAEFDTEGNLWLRRYEPGPPGPSIWEVHSAQGEVRAQVVIPQAMDLLEIGPQHILGLIEDSLDVESVVRFDLGRTGVAPDR